MPANTNPDTIETAVQRGVELALTRLRENPTPLIEPEWLSTESAAAYLNMPHRTLEDYRLRGIGPAYSKVGQRYVRYRRRDLDAWLLAGRVDPANAG